MHLCLSLQRLFPPSSALLCSPPPNSTELPHLSVRRCRNSSFLLKLLLLLVSNQVSSRLSLSVLIIHKWQGLLNPLIHRGRKMALTGTRMMLLIDGGVGGSAITLIVSLVVEIVGSVLDFELE